MRDRDLVDLQAGDIGEVRGVAGEHGEFVRECGGGDQRVECSCPGGAPGCSQAGSYYAEPARACVVEGQRIKGRLGHLHHELTPLAFFRISGDQRSGTEFGQGDGADDGVNPANCGDVRPGYQWGTDMRQRPRLRATPGRCPLR